jgi:muramoyltetrapeptide carboxypeptidase
MHAPNLTALGRSDHETRAAWIDALESPQRARRFSGLAGLVQGRATGPLFGGNLSMLHACAAAGRLVVPRGAVLLIEDVGEWPYRIDRMLSTLRAGGYLDGLSGIVAGQFDACRAGSDGVGVDQVLAERLADLGIPIATRLPVGHGRHNAPLILGANATIDVSGNSATLSLGS